jgi:hypothetical protein
MPFFGVFEAFLGVFEVFLVYFLRLGFFFFGFLYKYAQKLLQFIYKTHSNSLNFAQILLKFAQICSNFA